MEGNTGKYVSEIRSFNRFYTRILGLLKEHLLNSPYSLTEVRILLEIAKMEACTANKLIDRLEIDRGYMSRVLKSFEDSGLIIKHGSIEDKRKVLLELTDKGKAVLSELEAKSDRQVEGLIGHLTEGEKQQLVESMNGIKSALLKGIIPITIRDYEKGDVPYIIERHRTLYASEYGFGPEFCDYVGAYVQKFDENHDEEWENIWIAEAEGKPVGMIAIVRANETTAQLRWFLIEPEIRGIGLGYRLMETAIDFCREKGYSQVFLWTVDTLKAARALYGRFGFRLTQSKPNDTWSGRPMDEERWDLDLH